MSHAGLTRSYNHIINRNSNNCPHGDKMWPHASLLVWTSSGPMEAENQLPEILVVSVICHSVQYLGRENVGNVGLNRDNQAGYLETSSSVTT